ncbi:phosphatidylinositol N-acetylglucosaminyltransferase GPI15 NDAI_0G00590 [Naumovozyma dairenensis CBS 421]|uniref:Phosphatidylinositol N-acetylglucosaminyltransferase subunit H conserved domain-containing protein n=1 Tax=Naumovozyma dairenensis (strain ATCC 10597 / BCRC 20456 / CBS 421 / NBRC 0211 / NRRL Y-12639) TaxID=1071378 RepID=G0WDH4_NAUDC|nr:hypothetical protein NDAI_0G00590 [Naumovozyma dairenensis CBS 421]CCD25835.2 hypothetical protein NDAI_0G00590 [Naumovozyma dairenensis CBS 421]
MDTNGLYITKRVRKNYIELIEQNENNDYIKFTVIPRSFSIQRIARIISCIIITFLLYLKLIKRFDLTIMQESLIIIVILVMILSYFKNPRIESFTVLKDNGIQISKIDGYLFLPMKYNEQLCCQNEFFPNDKIIDIIINEGFYPGSQVIFYMAVLIKDYKELKLLFDSTKIKLDDQIEIYNKSRDCLYMNKKPFEK